MGREEKGVRRLANKVDVGNRGRRRASVNLMLS